MWNKELVTCARAYTNGVLTLVEESGYPLSVRCAPTFDDTAEVITIPNLPPPARGAQGKACLLFHRHKPDLSGQYELMIKGELTNEDGVVTFHPTGFLSGSGSDKTDRMPVSGTMIERLQFMRLGQRKAGEYLKKRGAPWPPRPWKKMLDYLDK